MSSAPAVAAPKLSTWQSFKAIGQSRRLWSVALLSFASGLPLGFIWIAVPVWVKSLGADLTVVGLFTLAQAPWSFKFLWAPLMDRFALPWLGRKRGWMVAGLLALFAGTLALAVGVQAGLGLGSMWALTCCLGFAAASFDIVYDAYAVEVLRPEEQGVAVGARTGLYRLAMFLSGGLTITLAGRFEFSPFGHTWLQWQGHWPLVCAVMAFVYLPFLGIVWLAPEPELPPDPPRRLREAVWQPFVALMGQHRVLEILSFVVLFKLTDNLTQGLLRPFFLELGFSSVDVGVVSNAIGTWALIAGALVGGILTTWAGLVRALWITGGLQMVSNLGYAVLAEAGPQRVVLYGAQAFEYFAGGMGTGAFGVLLMRLTERRFSATQFALLSSLFSIPRVLAGPAVGLLADQFGWTAFFVFTVFAGLPGLYMLSRFVRWGEREPVFHVQDERRGAPIGRAAWLAASLASALGTLALTGAGLALLQAGGDLRAGRGFDFAARAWPLLWPQGPGGWLTVGGLATLAASVGLGVAALLAARRGLVPRGGER